MRIDAYTHFFPKKFFDKLNEVASDYKDMGKRVRSLPAPIADLEEGRPDSRLRQQVGDLRGVRLVRAVVEGQGNDSVRWCPRRGGTVPSSCEYGDIIVQ